MTQEKQKNLVESVKSIKSVQDLANTSKDNPPSKSQDEESLTVSDIIGNFGIFQFIVLLFSSFREGCAAFDSVVASTILEPVQGYVCNNDQVANNDSTTADALYTDQCYQRYDNSEHALYKCQSWSFTNSTEIEGKSTYLTVQWQLVCDRQWLSALIQTIFFFGIIFGNLILGYLGDTYGRKFSYVVSHLITVLSGFGSILVTNYWGFLACRFLHGFGAAGYIITYSMYSEVIGAKLRSGCGIVAHFGWGFFLIMIPVILKNATDYRHVLGVSPFISLITLPIAIWLPESSRLLMAKGRFAEGREILLRIVKINRIKLSEDELNDKLDLLEAQIKLETEQAEEERRGKNLYSIIFTDRIMSRDTFIMCYLCFLGQMLYFVLTLNYYYIDNLQVDDNFLKSGLGEWIGIVLLSILLRVSSRRTSFRLFMILLLISLSFQYLIDLDILTSLNTRWFIVVNDGIGNMCTANILFITITVTLEVYPAVARDTGKSIVCGFLEVGSTLAPFVIQLGRLIGYDKINLGAVIMTAIGFILSEFLSVNDNIELSNT